MDHAPFLSVFSETNTHDFVRDFFGFSFSERQARMLCRQESMESSGCAACPIVHSDACDSSKKGTRVANIPLVGHMQVTSVSHKCSLFGRSDSSCFQIQFRNDPPVVS